MKMTPWREENMEMCIVRIRAVKMSHLEGALPEIKCSMKETYFRRKCQINILYFENAAWNICRETIVDRIVSLSEMFLSDI